MEAVVGTLLLLVAKFFGYAWYFRRLTRRSQLQRNPYLLAVARIGLGAVFAALLWWFFPGGRADFLQTYFIALAGGRALAWAIVIGAAFRWQLGGWQTVAAVAGGVLLSYAIEIPLALGVITAIGGIC
jgi:hypothetical protein